MGGIEAGNGKVPFLGLVKDMNGMDIAQIRARLLEYGSCRAYADGFFYTSLSNCTQHTMLRYREEGWNLIGILHGQQLHRATDLAIQPNVVVFRRKAPAFFLEANPWRCKGPHPWLPDLTTGVDHQLAEELGQSAKHGLPITARRFRCRCGCTNLVIQVNSPHGWLNVRCVRCHRDSVVMSLPNFQADFDSLPVLVPTLLLSWLRARKQDAGDESLRHIRYTSWFGFLRRPSPPGKFDQLACSCGQAHFSPRFGHRIPDSCTRRLGFFLAHCGGNLSGVQYFHNLL